jgi:hypothetical protein
MSRWVHIAALLTAAIVGCDTGYTLTAGTPSAVAYEPAGEVISVSFVANGASAGVPISLSAIPSTISVNPASATSDNNGKVTAYAVVPYGTTGVVVATTSYSNAQSVPIAASPITLCGPSIVAAGNGRDVSAVGEVYTVSVQALVGGETGGTCVPDAGPDAYANNDARAPAGIAVSLQAIQASAGSSAIGGTSGSSTSSKSTGDAAASASPSPASSLVTNAAGVASADVLIPWGASVVVQANGGGNVATQSFTGIGNPVTLSCLSWSGTAPAYTVQTTVTDGQHKIAGASVNFTVVYPTPAPTRGMPRCLLNL